MSMYNMIFGSNPDAEDILRLLGKTAGDFGRFRSVFLEDGYIVVHTRNGVGTEKIMKTYSMKCPSTHGIATTRMIALTAHTPTYTSRFLTTTRTLWPSNNLTQVQTQQNNGLNCLP